jgi:hypothetical protein
LPPLTDLQAQVILALFGVFFGIVIESRFASRWTIFFNVAGLLMILSTVELSLDNYYLLGGYTAAATGIGFLKGNKYKTLKHLFGAKSYSALMLSLSLFQAKIIPEIAIVPVWVIIAIPIYIAWHKFRKAYGKD